MSVLALAKAYHLEMDPTLLAGGFPKLNTNDTPFMKADFQHCVRETGPASTTIAHGLDLIGFQIGFNESGQRMDMPQPKPFELIPPRKQAAAVQAGSSTSNILIEDMVFEALFSMQWVPENLRTGPAKAANEQVQEKPEEPAQSNPATAEAERTQTQDNPAN